MFELVLVISLLFFFAQVPDAGASSVLGPLATLAEKSEPAVESAWVKAWLAQVRALKSVQPASWYCTKDKQRCQLSAGGGSEWVERTVDDAFVYTRVTDPLGYVRPFELRAQRGFSPQGKKLLDFGYGNLGQLVPLARLGAEVHGVEVDRLLVDGTTALQGKQGSGTLTLHHGYFVADATLVKALGRGYDLWLSKNTLKRGYVNPDKAGLKPQIPLGEEATVLATIFGEIKPGGLFMIYNFTPPQTPEYVPMADGRSPFSKEALEKAGFEVLVFDADDTAAARALARLLPWEQPDFHPESELFATWTLARRPSAARKQ